MNVVIIDVMTTLYLILIKSESNQIYPYDYQNLDNDANSSQSCSLLSTIRLYNRKDASDLAIDIYRKHLFPNVYIIDSNLYMELYMMYQFNISSDILKGYEIAYRKRKPFEAIPEYSLVQILPLFTELKISFTRREILRLLKKGRSKLIDGSFKISLDIDDYGIIDLIIHPMSPL